MNMDKIIAGIIGTMIVTTILYGYIMNIVAIAFTVSLPVTGMFILRIIGIFVAPLGVVLGFF
jgi:hypothetical protein